MILSALIRKRGAGKPANDNPAKVANDGQGKARSLARLAPLALANPISPEGEPLPDPAMEARRQRVLAMLAKHPNIRRAVVVDNPDTDPVIVALGIRGAMQDVSIVTCEFRIPREKFDPFLFLELVERHGGTVH